MMNRFGILVAALLLFCSSTTIRATSLYQLQANPDQVVGFLVDEREDSAAARAPWETYAAEQGIPHRWIAERDLALYSARTLRAHFLAIVVPDRINRFVSEDAANVLDAYAREGGVVAIVGDAGTDLSNGRFADRAELAGLAGVEYLRFRLLGKKSFGHSGIRFISARTAYEWHVPPGKLAGGSLLSSYAYGALTYPLPATRADAGTRVDATSVLGPALTERRDGSGEVFYVALGLGYLRSIGDSFPMNMVMRHVIFDVAAAPHLVASPGGRGAIILNWHIDSNAEWKGIPNFVAHGLLRHDIRYDFDITAGPDFARIGDGLGFDACGRGRSYVEALEPYGTIGSHGGWMHNWFARNVEAGRLDEAQMRALIALNDRCLDSLTHHAVLDYAAPDGAHPWQMTDAIASLGIRAYYYTGDTGAPPELAFSGGKLVSNRAWAFPIMPNGSTASLAEMSRAGVPPSDVEAWLSSTLDQAERDRSIYLMYSHIYDLQRHPQYIAPLAAFLDRLEREQRSGRASATTMVAASTFLSRFVQTRASFVRGSGGVLVRLSNPDGLQEIAFALPRSWIAFDATPSGVTSAGNDATYSYFCVRTNATQLALNFKPERMDP